MTRPVIFDLAGIFVHDPGAVEPLIAAYRR